MPSIELTPEDIYEMTLGLRLEWGDTDPEYTLLQDAEYQMLIKKYHTSSASLSRNTGLALAAKIAYDHSQSQGNPHNMTTSDINEGTKLFFTEPRVNQTVLTGLNTSIATPALATDNLLAAIGKLQAQISNSSSGSSGFNWVDADQISGLTLDPLVQHKSLKFAKKDGILWVCGSLHAQGATNASTKFFNISNSAYMVEQHVTNFFGAASQVAVCNINAHPITIGSPPSNANALAMFYVLNTNLYLRTSYAFSADGGFIAFNPTPIGRLLN